jgi:hypothetical protein
MMDEVGDGKNVRIGWKVREVFVDGVGGRDLALVFEHGHGHASDGLGQLTDVIDGLRLRGKLVFHVGLAEASFIDNLPLLDNGHDTARPVRPLPFLEDASQLLLVRLGLSRGCRLLSNDRNSE